MSKHSVSMNSSFHHQATSSPSSNLNVSNSSNEFGGNNNDSIIRTSNSFIRVFFENPTTVMICVIEKKQTSLKDALEKKLKCRNIDFDINNCVVYDKETKAVIDIDSDPTLICSQDIVIRNKSEVEHNLSIKKLSLKDKLFPSSASSSSRNCQFCHRLSVTANECQKCNFVICQDEKCLEQAKISICPPESCKNNNKHNKSSSSSLSSNLFSKSKLMAITRTATLKRKLRQTPTSQNIISNSSSQHVNNQSIPQYTLTPIKPSRLRSMSEPDIWNNKVIADITNANEDIQKVPEEPRQQQQHQEQIEEKVYYNHQPKNEDYQQEQEEKKSVKSSSSSSSSPNATSPSSSQPESSPKQKPRKRPNRWSSLLNWEIPATRIKIHKHFKLGHGSFGVVHKGTDFYHGVVAVKFLNVAKPSPSQVAAFKNEVAILKSTRHDNILLFIGCFLSEQLAIVTEWCPGSSLYRHLHVEEVHWPMYQLIDIARQTSQGMEYLHAKDILHRDLKSNNIFLVPNDTTSMSPRIFDRRKKVRNNWLESDDDQDSCEEDFLSKWTVKIGDFGLATVKSMDSEENQNNSQNNKRPTGSVLWMAPEVINQKVKDPYTQKADVYSFSVVLYELMTGSLPFQSFQHKEPNMILFWVGRGLLKLDLNELRHDTPPDISDIIRTCSDYDRDKRLDFVEITKLLKQIRLSSPKPKRIKRVQSTPNMYFPFTYEPVFAPPPLSMTQPPPSPHQSTNSSGFCSSSSSAAPLTSPNSISSSTSSTPSMPWSPRFVYPPPAFFDFIPPDRVQIEQRVYSDILLDETITNSNNDHDESNDTVLL